MVARSFRLREERDVRRVRARGKAFAHGALVARVLANALEPAQNRYTVIAGKKCGNSVERNRLKRITREAIRSYHPYLRTGFDIAFICRGDVSEMPDLTAAQTSVLKILTRAALLTTDTAAGTGPVPEPGTAAITGWSRGPGEEQRS